MEQILIYSHHHFYWQPVLHAFILLCPSCGPGQTCGLRGEAQPSTCVAALIPLTSSRTPFQQSFPLSSASSISLSLLSHSHQETEMLDLKIKPSHDPTLLPPATVTHFWLPLLQNFYKRLTYMVFQISLKCISISLSSLPLFWNSFHKHCQTYLYHSTL